MSILKKIKNWSIKSTREGFFEEKRKTEEKTPWANEKVKSSIKENTNTLTKHLGDSADIKRHDFKFSIDKDYNATVFFLDGLVSMVLVNESVIAPLINCKINSEINSEKKPKITGHIINHIDTEIILSADTCIRENYNEIFQSFLYGDAVLFIEGCPHALTISCKTWDKRAVSESQSEAVVRGPREGFTENFRTNTSLIRRKIKTPQLRMDHMTIGTRTDTYVCVTYINDVANPEIVKEVKRRLKSLNVDSILDAGYIEQYIEDSPFSLFPTVGYSEKPDVIAARLLEGRIGIVVDGSPFVLTVPMLFLESFQTAEDYYIRTFFASLSRILRFIAFFLATLAPSVFIALVSFHQEMIPTRLLFTIANSWDTTPFPAIIETLLLVFAFEILREAGLRLPRPVGQSIGIVGALIIGDAAVSAGIVGSPTVFVVAVTAVSSYVIPEQYEAIAILRVLIMIATAIFGALGIAIGVVVVAVHLAKLQSFGVPYMPELFSKGSFEDHIIRSPLWAMENRPESIGTQNKKRRSFFVPPAPKNPKKQIITGR